jgi:hypothetical protein
MRPGPTSKLNDWQEAGFYLRHYLTILGSGLAVIAATVWKVWWIVPVFAVFVIWSVVKLRPGPAAT